VLFDGDEVAAYLDDAIAGIEQGRQPTRILRGVRPERRVPDPIAAPAQRLGLGPDAGELGMDGGVEWPLRRGGYWSLG